MYCHIGCEDGISHESKRLASTGTLRTVAKGEKETCEQEVDVGILEIRVKHFDCLSADNRWVHGGVG